MANSLGSLTVRLGLDAAEFVSGLTKSEYEAKKLARTLDRHIGQAASLASAAIATIGVAAAASLYAVDKLVKQAGDFQDLAEKTGASAAALASLSVAAKIGGTDVTAVAEASIKLTKNLSKINDESKGAGAALKAIGIPLKEFKQLDPAAQMEKLAKALAGFDEPGKTAVMEALVRGGAQLLPFLKELGEGVGRVNILTEDQIKLADEYADKQARAKAELNAYAQAMAIQAAPAILVFTDAMTEAVKELLEVDKAATGLAGGSAVQQFAESSARSLAVLADGAFAVAQSVLLIGRSYGIAAAIVGAVSRGEFRAAIDLAKEARAEGEKMKFSLGLQEKVAAGFAKLGQKSAGGESLLRKPTINITGLVEDAAGSQGAAKRDSEAQRYLESLQKQLEKTQDLTVVEQVLADLQARRIGGVTPALEKEILSTARLIDLRKADIDVLAQQTEAGRKAAQAAGELFRQAEDFALSVEAPAERLTRQMEDLRRAVESNPLITDQTASRVAQKYWDDYIATIAVAKEVTSEADEFAKRAAGNIQDQLGSGLYDLMSGNFKNIGQSFTNMVNRMVAEAAAAQISRNLFGDLVKGGSGEGVIGGFIKRMLGAGSSSTGNTAQEAFRASEIAAQNLLTTSMTTGTTAMATLTAAANAAATALSSISVSGGGGGGGSLFDFLGGSGQAAFSQTALGSSGFGTGLAYGNMDIGAYLATGGPALPNQNYRVNEQGPELLDVNGKQFLMMGNQRGQVKPISGGASGGDVYHISVAMPQGGSRQTAMQFGADVSRSLEKSRRNR